MIPAPPDPTDPLTLTESFHRRRANIRRELRRHHLSERDRHLAEIILDMTLGWQRPSIIIPQLQCFTDLTGIGKSHVSEGLSDLHLMRIIRLTTYKGQPVYSVREDVENWKVKPRVSESAMVGSINLIREWNGMEPLPTPLEAIANFKTGPQTMKPFPNLPESGIPKDVPIDLPLL